jgi:hypothetical protein
MAPWLGTIAVFAILLATYLANGREIGTYDTYPTHLAAFELARGRGLTLDRYRAMLRDADGRRPPFVAEVGRHVYSRYPLASAIMASPVVWVQAAWYDQVAPGWERNAMVSWAAAQSFGKPASALIVATAGAVFFRLLYALAVGSVAWPVTLIVFVGSNLWTVASQALWQHGAAALWLNLALLGLARPGVFRRRVVLAGLAAGLVVATRASDALLAAGLVAMAAAGSWRRLVWFLPPLVVAAGVQVAYNVAVFDTPSGGQAALEALHPETHHTPAGVLTGNPLTGLPGTLVSPSRGLLVFCPWVVPAVAWGAFGARRRLGPAAWAVAGLVPHLVLLSVYPVWWAGHSFGPRYWTEAMPLFGLLLAVAAVEARTRLRPIVLALAAAWAIGIQAIGATCYPSDWNIAPSDIDRDHPRLWDWRDTELSRCLKQGPH